MRQWVLLVSGYCTPSIESLAPAHYDLISCMSIYLLSYRSYFLSCITAEKKTETFISQFPLVLSQLFFNVKLWRFLRKWDRHTLRTLSETAKISVRLLRFWLVFSAFKCFCILLQLCTIFGIFEDGYPHQVTHLPPVRDLYYKYSARE
jgi:hypothetical protein